MPDYPNDNFVKQDMGFPVTKVLEEAILLLLLEGLEDQDVEDRVVWAVWAQEGMEVQAVDLGCPEVRARVMAQEGMEVRMVTRRPH